MLGVWAPSTTSRDDGFVPLLPTKPADVRSVKRIRCSNTPAAQRTSLKPSTCSIHCGCLCSPSALRRYSHRLRALRSSKDTNDNKAVKALELKHEWAKEARIGPNISGQQRREGPNKTQGAPASTSRWPQATIEVISNPWKLAGDRWSAVPGRYKAVGATSVAFVICNMDKVNISVAIIPMAQDFGWSPTIAGLVQSSFFYGYLLSQIPGGYAASRLGGRTVLPAGVGLWSAATAAVPFLAATIPGMCVSRAAVGLGEGVAPSAAADLVARTIHPSERSRAISFIFGGLHVGSLLGLIVAPAVIKTWGWQAVFYLFGGLGIGWALWWERLMTDIADSEPALSVALGGQLEVIMHGNDVKAADTEEIKDEDATSTSSHDHHGGVVPVNFVVPWRAFLRNRPVQALAYTHFCNNWFHYTMLAWLPTYFTDSLSLDLTGAAFVSILPPIAAIVVSAIAGSTADALISRGTQIATVRKSAQCAAFLGPAVCLLGASAVDSGPATVALITLALGLASFSLAGLYCNHADLSPRYASVLLGLTNTSGALPGILGVAFTGWLFDHTGSWTLALFMPSVFFFLTGSAVYVAFGSDQQQDFEAPEANRPFRLESLWNK